MDFGEHQAYMRELSAEMQRLREEHAAAQERFSAAQAEYDHIDEVYCERYKDVPIDKATDEHKYMLYLEFMLERSRLYIECMKAHSDMCMALAGIESCGRKISDRELEAYKSMLAYYANKTEK